MILADENISNIIIYTLRNSGVNVFSIKENARGSSDISIADFSLNPKRIILTEDKDFGYLAFDTKINLTGCILLRYFPIEEKEIIEKLVSFLQNQTVETLTNKFVTITPQKIRITEIEF